MELLILVERRLEREALAALAVADGRFDPIPAPSLGTASRMLAERGAERYAALAEADYFAAFIQGLHLSSLPTIAVVLRNPQTPTVRSRRAGLWIDVACRDTPWRTIAATLLRGAAGTSSGRGKGDAAPMGSADGAKPIDAISEVKVSQPLTAAEATKDVARRGIACGAADDRRLASLTRRERQVLELVAGGASVRECAASLSIAVSTVDNHKSRLMRKLGVRKSSELVRFAFRVGIAP
ncbi:MAG: helix-turn-helix transcriptional regulator [Planctomycetota bacterium]